MSEDWLKSSLKEHLMGVSVGLLSTMNHNISYNLAWRTLADPARISSNSIREQLGHSLLSSIKYAYKVDQRDSSIRPTRGYAFLSSSQVRGLAPESKYSRFVRQVCLGFLVSMFYLCSLKTRVHTISLYSNKRNHLSFLRYHYAYLDILKSYCNGFVHLALFSNCTINTNHANYGHNLHFLPRNILFGCLYDWWAKDKLFSKIYALLMHLIAVYFVFNPSPLQQKARFFKF